MRATRDKRQETRDKRDAHAYTLSSAVCKWIDVLYCVAYIHNATHCTTLQHTATHCNSLQIDRCIVLRDIHTLTHTGLVTDTHILQHTVTHGNTRQHTATHGNTRQHNATHSSTLALWQTHTHPPPTQIEQCVFMLTHIDMNTLKHKLNSLKLAIAKDEPYTWQYSLVSIASSPCHAPQHATEHSATLCNTRQLSATLCNSLHHTATHCNTLQHTATHCNTLQYTATLGYHATYVRCLPLASLWRMDRDRRGRGVRGVGEATGDVLDSFRLVNNPSLCSPPTHITPHSQETVGKEAYTLQHTATHCNKPQHTRRPQIVRRQLGKRATRRGLFAAWANAP